MFQLTGTQSHNDLPISPREAAALRLAAMSQGLLPLMKRSDISLAITEPNANGLCIADATRNPTHAYKIRGALASVASAKKSGRDVVVTASAGNHGAGVARAAQMLGLKALVYVPANAPQVKVDKIEGFGAMVVKCGESFDQSLAEALNDSRVSAGRGVFIHPFDDLMVAAGQGTIGLELLSFLEELQSKHPYERVRVFLPVGGGGLLAGVASTLKTLWNPEKPEPEIVGVVDESSPAALLGTLFGRPVCAVPDTIADGTKVALIGETFLSVSHLIDHMMLVPHDSIVAAMRRHERETFTQLEGAGALALAGEAQARKHRVFGDDERTVSIALVSGRNVDPKTFHEAVTAQDRLDRVLNTRQRFDVRVPEREGELLHFLRTVKSFNIASLTYKQRPGSQAGTVRVEFEVRRGALAHLERAIMTDFPGSHRLQEGEEMVYPVGAPVAKDYHDELITLDDQPGSFLRCVEQLTQSGSFGAVGFLFYRKPAHVGRQAQVVLGLRDHPRR